jgi:hypothetical protein
MTHRQTRSLTPLLCAALLFCFASLSTAQTRPRPAPSENVRTVLIPLKYISVYDVIALFGGTVVDGRNDFMGLARGGLNNQFQPYGSVTRDGGQTTVSSPLGSSALNLPSLGPDATRGLRGTAGALTRSGLFPGSLQDLGLSLLGWPQTNTVILSRPDDQ